MNRIITSDYNAEVYELLNNLKNTQGYLYIPDLVKRFEEIDKEYNSEPWNLLQILANVNMTDDVKWIPCEEKLPKEREYVQITYLGYYDQSPYCDGIAYIYENEWHWSLDDEEVNVAVIAWMPLLKPYRRK